MLQTEVLFEIHLSNLHILSGWKSFLITFSSNSWNFSLSSHIVIRCFCHRLKGGQSQKKKKGWWNSSFQLEVPNCTIKKRWVKSWNLENPSCSHLPDLMLSCLWIPQLARGWDHENHHKWWSPFDIGTDVVRRQLSTQDFKWIFFSLDT